jgi:tetratricopeptide (TPR) repeat protein
MIMRTIYKIPVLLIIATLFFLFSQSCSDILEEHPKTLFTTAYFETPQGIQDAVNAAYAGMRLIYAPNGATSMFYTGTDEWTYGEQPATNTSPDNYQHREHGAYTLTSSTTSLSAIWDRFAQINLCNTIIEYAPNVPTLSEDQINTIQGEAHFLRGLYYYNLVTQFGAVPLDLGGGDLKPNTAPFFGCNRLPLDETLVKNYQAIIDDFEKASELLPTVKKPDAYKLTKAAALHMLSKAYILRYYSAASQSTDIQDAYDAAMELITNREMYGVDLLPYFGDIFRQGNDYNKEILYAVERIPGNDANNMVKSPNDGIGAYENQVSNNFTPNYQQVVGGHNLINSRPLAYQRPLRKIAPTKWLTMTAFADKTNDCRYHASFRTLYRTATVADPGTDSYLEYQDFLADFGMVIGDTAWYMPDTQEEADAIEARGVNYFVVGPDDWYTNPPGDWIMHPAMIKFADSLRNVFNDGSGRPYPVCRLAETYLLAAEAAMQLGNNGEAADLVNVLKKRAAYKPGMTEAEVDSVAALIEVEAVDIDLDFILDERSREMAGEWVRWSDLAIRKYSNGTSCLIERVKAHNPDAQGIDKEKHLLRPIPQTMIDAIDDPDPEKYQNPGYSTSK